jgi:hypothetical protein
MELCARVIAFDWTSVGTIWASTADAWRRVEDDRAKCAVRYSTAGYGNIIFFGEMPGMDADVSEGIEKDQRLESHRDGVHRLFCQDDQEREFFDREWIWGRAI